MLWTLSATIPSLHPAPCCPSATLPTAECCARATHKQLAVIIAGFFVLLIGSSGLRPCAAPFGADQLLPESKIENTGNVTGQDPRKVKKTSMGSFFNWYYFFMCLSSLIGLTVIVYIQDNVGWGLGFGIPTGLSFLAAIIFIAGAPLYFKTAPIGSPVIRLVRVLVAAFRKIRLSTIDYTGPLHELSNEDFAVQFPGYQASLPHTEQFKFLDRAAMKMPEDSNEDGSLNAWKLCTVTEVEELKIILRMGPIWAASIILITAEAQQYTFSIFQAQTMDRHVVHGSSFQIPPASMFAFSTLTVLIMVPLYDYVFVPAMARITGNPRGISFMQRMSVGFLLSMAATGVGALIELKRKHIAKEAGLLDSPAATIPMSVFYLLPQHCLHGLGDSFMSVGHLDFLYDQSPESMRSTATSLFWTNYTIGNYLSSFMVTIIHHYTSGPNDWLPDNLNRGHLDYFLWVLTILQLVNFLIFCLFARMRQHVLPQDVPKCAYTFTSEKSAPHCPVLHLMCPSANRKMRPLNLKNLLSITHNSVLELAFLLPLPQCP